MSESIIKKKSFELAVRGVNLYKYLIADLFINYLFLKKNVMKVCIGWSS